MKSDFHHLLRHAPHRGRKRREIHGDPAVPGPTQSLHQKQRQRGIPRLHRLGRENEPLGRTRRKDVSEGRSHLQETPAPPKRDPERAALGLATHKIPEVGRRC